MKILDTSATDDLRSKVPEWPVTKSRLGLPQALARGIIAAIALVLGLAWLTVANVQNVNPVYTVGCGLVFAFFALLVLLLLPSQLANRRFLHAAEEVLPEVPRTPLLIASPYTNGAVTHELVQTPSSIVLKPRANPYGGMPWFGYLWPIFTGMVMITLVWTPAWFADLSLFWKYFWKTVLTLGLCLNVSIFVWVVSRAFRDPPGGLAVVEIDQLRNVCVITRDGESVTIDVRQVLAVQLCAAWLKIEDLDHQNEDYDNKQCHSEVELNLIWRDRLGPGAGLERINLMNLGWQYHKLVPIARTLADALGVPLLNHATASHCRAERLRSKDRPYIAVGRARRYPAG
jgi:hypothetical protein